MNSSYTAIEQRIQVACEAARAQKNAKITTLARAFDVPMSRKPRTQRIITTKRLDDSQEAALISWLGTLDALHVPSTACMVEASANAMIQRGVEATKDTAAAPVNKMWVYQFVKRLPDGLHLVNKSEQRRRELRPSILVFCRPVMIILSHS